ncbi:MAG: aminopeptidase [bacterium]|nr:aminopeptidase [bacterium]
MSKSEMIAPIKNLFLVNLGVRSGERVLVLTDKKSKAISQIAKSVAECGKELGLKIDFLQMPSVSSHSQEPQELVWKKVFSPENVLSLKQEGLFKKLLSKEASEEESQRAVQVLNLRNLPDVVIAITYFSTTHTNFRRLLTKKGTRYASMPLFSESMWTGAMDVDYEEMAKQASKLKKALEKGEDIEITALSGTKLKFSIKDRPIHIDSGILRNPGDFGNLPAGEVFLAPVEGTAKGRLVINFKKDKKLSSPIIAEIKNGRVTKLTGTNKKASQLRDVLEKEPLASSLAEFGIGVNPKAKNPNNILEAEKILGTIHIAFGDNIGFGGMVSVNFHEDFVVSSPQVVIWKKKTKQVIIESGKVLI